MRAFLAIIIITILLTSIPAYIVIRAELDKQTWKRVQEGGMATMALLENEKLRLEKLATLLSQRPTLHELIKQGDSISLNAYMQTFQKTVALDILLLGYDNGEVIAHGVDFYPTILPIVSQGTNLIALPGTKPQLALLTSKAIPLEIQPQVFITAGILLDNEFANRLGSETGFEHSFLINGERVGTSSNEADLTIASEAVKDAISSGTTQNASLEYQNSKYYLVLKPLECVEDEICALAEIILPIENLLAANRKALWILILCAVLTTLAAYGLALHLSKRLTAPLKKLTEAAIKISQGDFVSSIPIPKSPVEIVTLASAFEKSRQKTLLALEDLSRTEAWSETLIQSVGEGIITIDNQGVIASFNQGAEKITGWTSDEAIGLSVNRVFPQVEEDKYFLQCLDPSGSVQNIQARTRHGEKLVLAVSGSPMHSKKIIMPQKVLVIRDISEEEAVRRLRSYFLANISHEFRTPLTALNASVELLLEDLEDYSLAEIAELLNSIHLSVTSLQTLIDNLLESASIEAGRFRIRYVPTDLADMVTNALQVMRPLFERRQQYLSLIMPTQMRLIKADPIRLTQVLVNLLSNASKYSPMQTTITLEIKINDPNYVNFAVHDQGNGIAPALRAKLFQPFQRLDETEDIPYGIGLGLAVVKAIIDAHHGKVGMQDRANGGSTFWFSLPIREEI